MFTALMDDLFLVWLCMLADELSFHTAPNIDMDGWRPMDQDMNGGRWIRTSLQCVPCLKSSRSAI